MVVTKVEPMKELFIATFFNIFPGVFWATTSFASVYPLYVAKADNWRMN